MECTGLDAASRNACRKPSNDTSDLRPAEIKVEDVVDTVIECALSAVESRPADLDVEPVAAEAPSRASSLG